MRISDWSSDVCSSDLQQGSPDGHQRQFSPAIQLYRPLRSVVELQHVALYQPERRAIWSGRSEEHTSELQSLMRISYAVFCWKTQNNTLRFHITSPTHIRLKNYSKNTKHHSTHHM